MQTPTSGKNRHEKHELAQKVMIPPGLTAENIQNAIAEIDREGVPPKRQSDYYDLSVNNNRYPPKYVISLASQYANGVVYAPGDFNAVEAKNYFIGKGYKIIDRRLEGGQTQKPSDLVDAAPERVATTTYRILRDTDLARQIKVLHEYKCQICGHTILLADGSFYAEAHHIRPLGAPHNGPDTPGNIICVCPNHHAELDYGVIPLSASHLGDSTDFAIKEEFLNYHNQKIYNSKNPQ
ncbi:MAG: HNH endonuclease [Bythopirellula sp.]|nr:HNH endonuclease [Bythopirellula sp.]